MACGGKKKTAQLMKETVEREVDIDSTTEEERRGSVLELGEEENIGRRLELLEAMARRGADGMAATANNSCFDITDSMCEDCAVINEHNGRTGHLFWDELELLRHGYADPHGNHWAKNEPRDEVEMRHHGYIDQKAHHIRRSRCSSGRGSSVCAPSDASCTCWPPNDGQKHIRLCDGHVTVPISGRTTSRTSDSSNSPSTSYRRQGRIREYALGGGDKLKTIDTGDGTTAIYLKLHGDQLLLQRGTTGRLLITATVDPNNPHNTLIRRLQH